jgi:hypothetical protein
MSIPSNASIVARHLMLRRVGPGSWRGRCPICGHDAFTVEQGRTETLAWCHHGCADDEARQRMLDEVDRLCGGAPRLPAPPPREKPAPRTTTSGARRIWRESVEPRGTIVERYLRSGGLELTDVLANRVIRFHRALPYTSRDDLRPAMITLFRNVAAGEGQAIFRTWLLECDGKIEHVRKSYGPLKATAAMLTPLSEIGDALLIGEGVETVMSALKLGQASTGWALGSSVGIQLFEPPPQVKHLIVSGEIDEGHANWTATLKLKARLGDQVTVLWKRPRVGLDANDEVLKCSPKIESIEPEDASRSVLS